MSDVERMLEIAKELDESRPYIDQALFHNVFYKYFRHGEGDREDILSKWLYMFGDYISSPRLMVDGKHVMDLPPIINVLTATQSGLKASKIQNDVLGMVEQERHLPGNGKKRLKSSLPIPDKPEEATINTGIWMDFFVWYDKEFNIDTEEVVDKPVKEIEYEDDYDI